MDRKRITQDEYQLQVERLLTKSYSESQIADCFNACPKHHEFPLNMIHIMDLEQKELHNQQFVCFKCLRDSNIPLEQILDFKTDIISESLTNSVIRNWPANDLDLYKRLSTALERSQQDTKQDYILKVNNFYKKFRSQLDSILVAQQEKHLKSANSFPNKQQQFLDRYNTIIRKSELKDLIGNSRVNLAQRTNQAKQIIKEVQENQVQIKQDLEKLIRDTLNEITDFEYPNRLVNAILQSLDTINFQNSGENQKQQQQQNVVKIQYEKEVLQKANHIKNIMKLINNPLNFVNEEYSDALHTELNNYSFIFDQMKLPPFEFNKPIPSLDNLDNSDLKQIERVAVDFNARKVKETQVLEESKSGVSILMGLVKNPFNFTTSKYINELEFELMKYPLVFDSLIQVPDRTFPEPKLEFLDEQDLKSISTIATIFNTNKQALKSNRSSGNFLPLQTNVFTMKKIKQQYPTTKRHVKTILDSISRFVSSFSMDTKENFIALKNMFGEEEAKILNSQIQNSETLTEFKFQISNSSIGDRAAEILASIIGDCHYLISIQLQLSQTKLIGDNGALCIAEAITKNSMTLVHLKFIFTFNPIIGEYGIKSIAKAIGACSNLTHLSYSHQNNKNFEDSSAQSIAGEISKLNDLKTLDLVLSFTKVSDSGALYLIQSIETLNKLKGLYLRLNDNPIIEEITKNLIRNLLIHKQEEMKYRNIKV